MKKHYLLIIFIEFILLPDASFAQNNDMQGYTEGIYRTYEDYKNGNLEFAGSIVQGEIGMFGTAKFRGDDTKIKKYRIDDIWGFRDHTGQDYIFYKLTTLQIGISGVFTIYSHWDGTIKKDMSGTVTEMTGDLKFSYYNGEIRDIIFLKSFIQKNEPELAAKWHDNKILTTSSQYMNEFFLTLIQEFNAAHPLN